MASDSASTSKDVPDASERRGIPLAQFVEDVEKFLDGRNPNEVIATLDERLQQYKLLEMRLLAQRRDLQGKLPDIKRCLEIVQALQLKNDAEEDMIVDFEMVEGIYTQAIVRQPSSVNLWLGANVMLEYQFPEAKALLEQNLHNCQASLEALINDIRFLQDQVNTMEVTIARVYNWEIQHRRRTKAAEVSAAAS